MDGIKNNKNNIKRFIIGNFTSLLLAWIGTSIFLLKQLFDLAEGNSYYYENNFQYRVLACFHPSFIYIFSCILYSLGFVLVNRMHFQNQKIQVLIENIILPIISILLYTLVIFIYIILNLEWEF